MDRQRDIENRVEQGTRVSHPVLSQSTTIAAEPIDPSQTINFCNGTTPTENQSYYCSFISRLPAGSVAAYAVDNPYLNIGQIIRKGWDFEASYRLGMGEVLGSGPGALTFRFSGTLLDEYGENLNNSGFISRKGETSASGSPDFITNSSITYDDDLLTMQLQMRTLSSGNYNNLFTEGVQISDNSVDGAAYLNFSTTIRANERAEFFAVINNLLDRDPELIPQNFGYPTVPQFFDTIGRSYRVGVRIKLP